MPRFSGRAALAFTALLLLAAASLRVTGPERVRLLVPIARTSGAQGLLAVSRSGSGSLVTCLSGLELQTRWTIRLPWTVTGAVSGHAGDSAWVAVFGRDRLILMSTEPPLRMVRVGVSVQRAWADDMDGDGADELLLIVDSRSAGRLNVKPPDPRQFTSDTELAIFSVALEGPLRSGVGPHLGRIAARHLKVTGVWRGLKEGFLPWQVTSGDVDGDGRAEVGVGVFRKTRFNPESGNRPYVYTWSGGDLSIKWLGSRLSRPFEDFWLLDLDADGRAELLALEQDRTGGRLLTAYRWNGFGFEGFAESPVYGSVSDVAVSNGRGNARIMVWAGARAMILSLRGDRLAPLWEGSALDIGSGNGSPVDALKRPLAVVDLSGDGVESIVAASGQSVRIIGKLKSGETRP